MGRGILESCLDSPVYQQYTTIYFTLNSDSENQDGWYIYLSDDELNDDEIEAWQKIVSIS